MAQKTVNITFNGEPGSGKTLLINKIEQVLAQSGIGVERFGEEHHSIKVVMSDADRNALGKSEP